MYSYFTYLFPVAVCMVIFTNHYTRDSVGALERQLETENLLQFNNKLYSQLNSVYFAPNIITPLLGSMITNLIGGPCQLMFVSSIVASIGQFLFVMGLKFHSISILFIGRFITGSMYEVIDCLPYGILSPLYQENWGLVVGLMNSFLRLGSVFNFIVSPIVYESYGLEAAFWVVFIISAVGALSAGLSCFFLSKLIKDASYADKLKPHQNESNNQNSFLDVIRKLVPLHVFSVQFYFFIIGSSLLYGAMVPFWLMGSKYLQIYYNMSVIPADTLLLFPEGMIVIVSIPLGICLDRFQLSAPLRIQFLSLSILSLTISYLMLIYGTKILQLDVNSEELKQDENVSIISPIYPMVLLGFGYAISNCLLSNVFVDVVQSDYIISGSALLACGMNFFPSIIPPFVTLISKDGDGKKYLLVLALVAVLSSVSLLISSFLPSYKLQNKQQFEIIDNISTHESGESTEIEMISVITE